MSAHAKREIAHAGNGQSLPITSTLLVPAWGDRIELQIVNSGTTGVWLAFQTDARPSAATPVAAVTAAGSQFYLAAGAAFKTNAYTGPVYGLSVTSPNVVSVLEV